MLKRNILITIFFRFGKRIVFIKITAKDNNEVCLTNTLNDFLTR